MVRGAMVWAGRGERAGTGPSTAALRRDELGTAALVPLLLGRGAAQGFCDFHGPLDAQAAAGADTAVVTTTACERRPSPSCVLTPLALCSRPPRYLTFHFYSSPDDEFGKTLSEALELSSQVAAAVKKQLPTTKLFLVRRHPRLSTAASDA